MSGDTGSTAGSSETDSPDYGARAREELGFSRWWLVVAAALAMAVVSPYQYVWSSIEGPMAADLDIPLTQLGLVFTLFVIVQSGSQFPVGWWRDEHGPRLLTLGAAALAGGSYYLLSYATEVWQLYLLYSLGALGVGIVYTISVNTALKWFPDRKGLTTGVGTMAFAAGAALFIPYVRANATTGAYDAVLQNMGLVIGLGILVAAVVLRDPPQSWFDARKADQAAEAEANGEGEATRARDYHWREMLRTWQFWLMYGMFVAVSGAGLMLTAKIVSFAQAVELDAATVTAAATLLPVAGGVGRLVLGELSDRLNRRLAMAASFSLCGLGLFAVVAFGQTGTTAGFLAAVVIATFFWSPQYTLFPSIVADYYGEEGSSANYALLYSGKMWGGVFGGAVAAWVVTQIGWPMTFQFGGVLALLAGVAALALREPGPAANEAPRTTTAVDND
ncbi:MFS transporter, OFA family, oxalate/formate antiporter [Halogranum gelatinilyticum]|uniref:MFS transporter, OFA family, oxalate/formate antiporter n=1 Tax=Halogranum gelatinilyticum TaxID=660521 RepID=A0A1G9ZA75_9EURY|nr:OFA family MFS transporter [Halogranum gelatinilyticum]SDN18290.1 MFS transporter, OFA family, oxalate/formate antiporter [Halogranum gelatinilyticum]